MSMVQRLVSTVLVVARERERRLERTVERAMNFIVGWDIDRVVSRWFGEVE